MQKNPNLVIIGKGIKAVRVSKGILQDEAAFESGLSRSYYSDVERGYRNVSVLNLIKIARGLDIELSELLPSMGELL
jgi:transcriptional regulator with XRE-family HTH domain